ncbi:hypothetical protein [Nitratireductor luteus]|uniref:hypothetical protein n=1 Tax=Nitratireductor luteus TaxID=2976980 RepID=UPI00223F1EF3|nr:hypothetical protein [Nitratireductor luteus]
MAGEADVVAVVVKPDGAPGSFRFDVTVSHEDAGWDHYVDQWEVLSGEDEVLATRVLAHPHVDEQPFTRSLSGVSLPAQIREVTIRARDSVHGYGGKEMSVLLPGG